MKKVFAIVAVAAAMIFGGKANAQLSVHGGVLTNVSPYTISTSIASLTDTIGEYAGYGFYGGLTYNIAFTEHWGIAPGVYVNYVGKNEDNTTAGTQYTDILSMVDINIPILFNYKVDFTSSFGIKGFVGPNIRYGLSANRTIKYKNDILPPLKTDLYEKSSGSQSSLLTRTDLGLMVGVGVHFNAFQIETGVNIGLLDRDPAKNTTQNFHQYFVGVGYTF